MERQTIKNILQHINAPTVAQTELLSAKIKIYPYFQALHALHLKGLYQIESFKYNNALKVTAAHTIDRSILFDFISSENFSQNDISKHIKQNTSEDTDFDDKASNNVSVNESLVLDNAIKMHIKTAERIIDPNLFEKRDEHPTEPQPSPSRGNDAEGNETISETEGKLNIGKPLNFNTSENHSFSEWLKITSFKPIVRNNDIRSNESISGNVPPLNEKLEIIDKFITNNPKIKPITSGSPKPKLVNNEEPEVNSLMTETLAQIYLEQKNYDKAILSYKILSLKYPEKSSFFATRIELVEKLKAQNNIA